MPKIREFRVILPLTLDEYQVGRLFVVAGETKNYPGGGNSIEVLKNEPFEGKALLNGKFHKGHYTYKVYHLSDDLKSQAPEFIQLLAPKGSLQIIEETWDAYPYTRTVLSNPMKESFSIVIETIHHSDRGTSDNIHELPPKKLKKRKVVMIDIADPINTKDYKPTEDPTRFKSVKTSRGPLLNKWKDSVLPVMTCYTLVTAKFKRFGSQTRVESSILKTEQGLITHFNRKVFCSIDQWHGMTVQDIGLLDNQTKEELNELCDQGTASVVRGHVIGEASNHTSGEMESHLKDPIEEDLTETLEKIHLSPGSPLPDFTQSMSDSSHARHYSHKLPTCVEQTQQQCDQGTARCVIGDGYEEASSHPSGEESHSKDPREDGLIESLEKFHLCTGSPSPSPDSRQPTLDSSRTLTSSQILFSCAQQIHQDRVEMNQQMPSPSAPILTSTASALGSPGGSEFYRPSTEEAAHHRTCTLSDSVGSLDPTNRPKRARNHSAGSSWFPRRPRSHHRNHGACSANRKLKRHPSSAESTEARHEDSSAAKVAKYQSNPQEPKKTEGNPPLMGNAPVARQEESTAAQNVIHQLCPQAPKNTASNPPLMGNAPVCWIPVGDDLKRFKICPDPDPCITSPK